MTVTARNPAVAVSLDPDGLWRRPRSDHRNEPPLSRLGALERADLLGLVSEDALASANPTIQLGGRLLNTALAAHILGGESIGRALGLEPPSGLTAPRAIRLAKRNALLRRARAAVPAWAAATDRQAAVLILAALDSYRTTAWPRDRGRETAPATEPAASFWRLLRLDPDRPAPGTVAGLARVLEGA